MRRNKKSIMMKEISRPAFTLLESLLALMVMGMVFMGLSYLIKSRVFAQPTVSNEKLIVVCQQLQRQGYVLEKAEDRQLTLTKEGEEEVKKVRVVKNQLILQGDRRGRMVLLDRVKEVRIQNFGLYQKVKVKGDKQAEAEATLFLNRKKEAHDEK